MRRRVLSHAEGRSVVVPLPGEFWAHRTHPARRGFVVTSPRWDAPSILLERPDVAPACATMYLDEVIAGQWSREDPAKYRSPPALADTEPPAEGEPSAELPNVYPCGCSKHKVNLGLCDHYQPGEDPNLPPPISPLLVPEDPASPPARFVELDASPCLPDELAAVDGTCRTHGGLPLGLDGTCEEGRR